MEKLKAQLTTFIGIFHDLEFMEGLCDDVVTMKIVEKEDVLL